MTNVPQRESRRSGALAHRGPGLDAASTVGDVAPPAAFWRDENGRSGIAVALELYDAAELQVRERYRREHPDATQDAVDAEVQRWLHDRPGAVHGDVSGGRLRPHP